MTKTGYKPTYTGTISESIGLDIDKNIIINSSATQTSTTKKTFQYAKAENTAAQNHAIFTTFASIIGGHTNSLNFDSLSNTQNIKFSVT